MKLMKRFFSLSVLVFSISCVATSTLSAAFGFPFNLMNGGGSDPISFAFLKSSDAARQKEYVGRQEQLAKIQAYAQDAAVRQVAIQEQARERVSALKQKMILMNDHGSVDIRTRELFVEREKTASAWMEASTELVKMLESHEALLKKFIAILNADMHPAPSVDSRAVFSWQQFKDAKRKLNEETAKLEYLKEKRGLAVREGARMRDQAALGNKQFEQDLAEFEARRDAAVSGNEREYFLTAISLQKALMEETVQTQRCEQDVLAQQEAYHSTEYALQKYLVHELEQKFPELQERMVFEPTDVTLAEQEYKAQRKEATEENSLLMRDFRRVRGEKEGIIKRKQAIEALKVKNETYAAELEKIEQEFRLLHERELLLGHKNHYIEAKVEQKKLQLFIVTVMYERANDYAGTVVPQKINGWFVEINQSKKQIETKLEQLNDYIQDGTLRAEEHRKLVESVNAKLQVKMSQSALFMYQGLLDVLGQLRQLDQEILTVNSQHAELCRSMNSDVDFVADELVREQRALNIWQRSRRAVSYMQLKQAWADMCNFSFIMYQRTLYLMSPLTLVREGLGFEWIGYLQLLFFFLFLFLFIFGVQRAVASFGRYIDRLLYIYQGKVWAIYLTTFRSFVRFIEQYSRSLAGWLFIRLHIAFDCKYYLFASLKPLYGPYFVSLFYVLSVPYFVYLSYHLMREIKTINQRMSFLFFTEALQTRFLLLLSSVLYTSSLLLPLRRVFLCTVITDTLERNISPMPNVIYGAWTLIISIVFLLFFNKQDVLRFIPSHGRIGSFLSNAISLYYYPVFFFVMGLFILINPYVGYSNLAVYIAACLPLSVVVSYGLLALHSWIRHHSLALFIKEEEGSEEEGTDRFEHAKMYYGVFVLMTFLIAVVCAFLAITNIWGIQYTLAQLWKGLSYDWVLSIEGTGVNIGFGGLLTVSLFMVSGFVISSVFSKFVLSKLFDIFHVEAGAQNTASRILHYAIVFLAIILGLHAIKLSQLANWLLFGLALGISFGARDLVADFFSGLWILIERPIEPGNFIETGNLRGTVKTIALRATTIRTPQNYSVIVPNRELVSKPIINWGGGYYAVGFEISVTVSYHVDPQKVRDLIAQVVANNPQILRIPAVMVRLEEFGEHGLVYKIRAFVSSRRVRDQWDIAGAIRIELLKMFQENNVGIPYPHLVVQQENAFGLSKEAYREMMKVEEESKKEEKGPIR